MAAREDYESQPLADRVDGLARFLRWWVISVCIALLLLTTLAYWSLSGVADNAKDGQQRAYENCVSDNLDGEHFNSLINETIESVKTSKVLTDSEKADRISRYTSVKQIIKQCEPAP